MHVPHLAGTLLSTPPLPHPNLPTKQDRRTLFNQWKAENGKKYANAKAENAAFATFSATVTDLVGHNSNGKNKFFKGECGWALWLCWPVRPLRRLRCLVPVRRRVPVTGRSGNSGT